jgi:hypothetical protein
MFASTWRRWLNRLSPRVESQPRGGRAARRMSPAVERLEDRWVPSTVRTITYDQITALPSNNLLNGGNEYDVLCANGNRAVFQSHDSATGDNRP